MKSRSPSQICALPTGGLSRWRCSSIHLRKLSGASSMVHSTVAMHFSSMAMGVGSRVTSTVVRQGGSFAKYSAQRRVLGAEGPLLSGGERGGGAGPFPPGAATSGGGGAVLKTARRAAPRWGGGGARRGAGRD